jgi:hypothetical protein
MTGQSAAPRPSKSRVRRGSAAGCSSPGPGLCAYLGGDARTCGGRLPRQRVAEIVRDVAEHASDVPSARGPPPLPHTTPQRPCLARQGEGLAAHHQPSVVGVAAAGRARAAAHRHAPRIPLAELSRGRLRNVGVASLGLLVASDAVGVAVLLAALGAAARQPQRRSVVRPWDGGLAQQHHHLRAAVLATRRRRAAIARRARAARS